VPTLKFKVSATTTDALSNRKFNVIPAGGAILNMWASTATAADDFGLSVGDRDVVVQGTPINLESANEVIDTDRDQVVFQEIVGPGQMFLPATVTADSSFLIHLRYL
jgi:hypothetical protein